MKKLNFMFRSGSNVIYNQEVSYSVHKNIITFNIDKEEFQIILGEYFSMIKSNNDGILSINNKDNKPICMYTLKGVNESFDIEINHFRYITGDFEYFIEYDLVSEDKQLKEISIKLLN